MEVVKKRRVSMRELLQSGAVPWNSSRTVYRKIKDEKFPAYQEAGFYYFDLKEVEFWMKGKRCSSAS
ncbi:MAG: hypothetical protein H0X02_03355 [Nitrosomonas sp.]|nr:hypothetical protein [Nitrosomonas sp.]